MKSLPIVRKYLESKVPELLEIKGQTHDNFFLQLLYLLPSNKYLQAITYLEEWENYKLLYIKPLGTYIRYEYLGDMLLGAYLDHADISYSNPWKLREDPITEKRVKRISKDSN